MPANFWEDKAGAWLGVTEIDGGCQVVCCIDNLRKGSVDTAIRNLKSMLGDIRA